MITIPIVQYYRIQNGEAVIDRENPSNKYAVVPASLIAEWMMDQFGIDLKEIIYERDDRM